MNVTLDVLVKACQASLSPDQYDHFEAMLESDPEAHERLAKSIEQERLNQDNF